MVASVFNCLNFLKEMDVLTIKAIVDDGNYNSIKLLNKLGFEKEVEASNKILFTKNL
ncbi:hypothetical protein ABF176_002538 [Flavobacterium psychrophilum]